MVLCACVFKDVHVEDEGVVCAVLGYLRLLVQVSRTQNNKLHLVAPCKSLWLQGGAWHWRSMWHPHAGAWAHIPPGAKW